MNISNKQSNLSDPSIRVTNVRDIDGKFKELKQAIQKHLKSDVNKALQAAEYALELAVYTENNSEIGLQYVNIGLCYYHMSKLDESVRNMELAVKVFHDIGNTAQLSRCFNNIGIINRNKGRHNQALKSYGEAIYYAKQIDDFRSISKVYNNIGNVYINRGMHQIAFSYFRKALKINEENQFHDGMGNNFSNIAHIYSLNNEYDKSIQFYKKSIEEFEKCNAESHKVFAQISIGENFLKKEKYDRALKTFLHSLSITHSRNDKYALVLCYNNLAITSWQLNQPKKMLEYFRLALQESDELQFNHALWLNTRTIHTVLKEKINEEDYMVQFENLIGHTKYKNMKKMLYESKEAADEYESVENKLIACEALMFFYEECGEYKKAFEFQKEVAQIKNEIYELEKLKEISKLKIEFENERKEQELERQKFLNENLEQLNAEINSKNKLLERQAKLLEQSNEELENFAYAASHDLKEPLRMIGMYTQLIERKVKGLLDEDTEECMFFVTDGVNRMQKLLDDLLEYSRVGRKNSNKQKLDLNLIIEIICANLQAQIAERNAVIEFGNLPPINANQTLITILFQNLISNGIKFCSKEKTPQITISYQQQNNEVVFCVSDNGIGIESQFKDQIFGIFKRLHTRDEFPGSGIGLSTCKKIIEEYGGKIWIESELDKGSEFYFTLPDALK